MPEYIAAINETNLVSGNGTWELTDDKAKALAADDNGTALFVSSLEDLVYELDKKFPAPEHCAIVFPRNDPGFKGVWSGSDRHAHVYVRPYVSSKLGLESALKLVRDRDDGLMLNWQTLGLEKSYERLSGQVIPGYSEFVCEYSDGNGWHTIKYDPKRARRILGAGKAAILKRLSQGIWPFDTELRFFHHWRDWLLSQVPEINTVFRAQYYYYRSPGSRAANHDAFVMLKTVTQRLRLMEKVRKQTFFKKNMKIAAQYLPGMMNKKDYHKGIIKLLQEELKAAGRKVSSKIPGKEIE